MEKSSLYVTNVGWERIEPGQAYPRKETSLYGFRWEDGRILPEFCLAWVHTGSGALEVANRRQKIPTKRAFLFRSGEWHRHRPDPERGWTLYWVGFNGLLPRQWVEDDEFDLDGNLAIIPDTALFETVFERLLDTVDRAPTTNTTALACQTAGLISHFLKYRDESRNIISQHADPIVNQAVEFIWNHHESFIDVAEVVAHIGVGRRALERRFASILGRSVLNEIQMCRLNRAKRLLQESPLPMKQIVFLAGMRSRNQLWLLFKKHVGMSPDEYRNKAGSFADKS